MVSHSAHSSLRLFSLQGGPLTPLVTIHPAHFAELVFWDFDVVMRVGAEFATTLQLSSRYNLTCVDVHLVTSFSFNGLQQNVAQLVAAAFTTGAF